jgi:hypothetical protein
MFFSWGSFKGNCAIYIIPAKINKFSVEKLFNKSS